MTETGLRIGIIGAGKLANVRARAIVGAPGAEVVAVASQRLERAQAFASSYPGVEARSVDDLFDRGELDAILVAAPHRVQDDLVLRAIDRGLDVLIGGPLASDLAAGTRVLESAAAAGLIVEAGYEARYKTVWAQAREFVREGRLGELVSVRSNAGFDQTPGAWYYEQEASGGMLVTHLSYAFLNPLRWLLGDPRVVSAVGNVKRVREPGSVDPETCIVLAEFPGEVVAAMTASYVKPAGVDDWNVLLVGTDAALEIHPGDAEGGELLLAPRGGDPVTMSSEADGFDNQVAAFIGAVRRRRGVEADTAVALRNPPEDAIRDLELCAEIDAIVKNRRS